MEQRRKDGGYLFRNEKKSEKQPDWRGKLTIDGKEWLISGWNRQQDGSEMISIAATDPASLPPRSGTGAPGGAQQTPPAAQGQNPFSKDSGAEPKKAGSSFSPGTGAGAATPQSQGYPDLDDLEDLFNS